MPEAGGAHAPLGRGGDEETEDSDRSSVEVAGGGAERGYRGGDEVTGGGGSTGESQPGP